MSEGRLDREHQDRMTRLTVAAAMAVFDVLDELRDPPPPRIDDLGHVYSCGRCGEPHGMAGLRTVADIEEYQVWSRRTTADLHGRIRRAVAVMERIDFRSIQELMRQDREYQEARKLVSEPWQD